MSVTAVQLAQLLSFAFTLAVGQILFKLGARRLPDSIGTPRDILSIASNGYLITGLACFVGATGLWIYILKRLPLSTAYPFSALAFVFVPFLGWIFLHESITARYLLGVTLIVGGVYVAGVTGR